MILNKNLIEASGIYVIRQRSTGMHYIGKSSNIKKRITSHIKSKTSLISKAIHEFGVNDFDIEAEYFPHFSPTELQDLEYECIKRFASLKPNGFNEKCRGARNIVTKETRKKMSDARKGMKREQFSAEHCKNISDAKKGKPRANVSPEQRQKISIALKGRKFSEEHRLNLSTASKGKTKPVEHRQKISAAGKARYENNILR